VDNRLLTTIRELARLYAEINKALKDIIPQPKQQPKHILLEKLYELKPAEPADIDRLTRELRLYGHGEIVDEILGGKNRKILVGVIYSYGRCGESAYRAYRILEEKYMGSREVVVEDFSTDALTIADTIRASAADATLVVAIKKRGRRPGIYSREVELHGVEGIEAVEEIRPSLEGLLDVDALIRGLNVFLGGGKLTVIECEPASDDCSDCIEGLVKAVERHVTGFRAPGERGREGGSV